MSGSVLPFGPFISQQQDEIGISFIVGVSIIGGFSAAIAADAYASKVTPAYAGLPDFVATIGASVQPFADEMALLATFSSLFDVDYAVGSQLDAVGQWIGVSRYVSLATSGNFFSWDTPSLGWEQGFWQGEFDPTSGLIALDDPTYRQLLYAKRAANSWDGTVGTAAALVPSGLFPAGTSAAIIDNGNLSMTIRVTGAALPPLIAAVLAGGYVPRRPAGIQLTYALMATAGTSGLPMYIPSTVIPH